MVRLLREAGVAETDLPTMQQMADYRAFASRQTAVRLLTQLQESWSEAWRKGWLVGESAWCVTEEEVQAAQTAYGRAILKAPWSGSGRGVHPTAEHLSEKDWAWIRRTLKQQGGVEVEPFYHKIKDFAMEFWTEGGQVHYEGLSLFETTAGGVYAGNLVASEEEKERQLTQYISKSFLRELRERLVTLLNGSGVPAWYTGPFGIDMMICRVPHPQGDPGGAAVHPFVELNLRMTMGWLAILLARQQQPHEISIFRIVQEHSRYRYEVKRLID